MMELCDPNTKLFYKPGDPHLHEPLLHYLEGGEDPGLLPHDRQERQAVKHAAKNVQLHPKLPGWLFVHKFMRPAGCFKWLVCPPLQFRWNIIRMLHECFGHCGIEQSLIQLHMHFHWAGIKADVRLYVRCCDACQRRKLVLPDPPALQQPIIYGPFKHVHVDLAGPFEVSPADRHPEQHATAARKPNGSKILHKAWVVLMVDYFTKVAEFGVVFSKGALDVSWSFWNAWVSRYGAPEHVTSDNGTEFGGNLVTCFRVWE